MRTALLIAIAAAAYSLLILAGGGTARAQTPAAGATVRVVAPGGSVATSTKQFDVSIDVENVQNLAGFQFVLAYDPKIVEALSAAKTQFLAKSGREIVCGQPTIDTGAIRMACVTLRLQPAGVDGSGTIATVTFKPLANGATDLVLKNVKLVHPDSTEDPSTAVSGRLSVSGSSGWTTARIAIAAAVAAAVVIVAAGGAVVLRRRSGAAASGADGTGGA